MEVMAPVTKETVVRMPSVRVVAMEISTNRSAPKQTTNRAQILYLLETNFQKNVRMKATNLNFGQTKEGGSNLLGVQESLGALSDGAVHFKPGKDRKKRIRCQNEFEFTITHDDISTEGED